MNRSRSAVIIVVFFVALALVAGCNVRVNKDQTASGEKNAQITTPFGSLKVETNNVSPKDAGLQAYPGARLVPKQGDKENDANVNIDTPWFGLSKAGRCSDLPAPETPPSDVGRSLTGRTINCKPFNI